MTWRNRCWCIGRVTTERSSMWCVCRNRTPAVSDETWLDVQRQQRSILSLLAKLTDHYVPVPTHVASNQHPPTEER